MRPSAAAGLPGCVTCHGNHEIKHPTDKMIGMNPQAVCSRCHLDGDEGAKQAAAMSEQLMTLAAAIDASDELLQRAQRQGMEVNQAEQQETQARDALVKARVTVIPPAKVPCGAIPTWDEDRRQTHTAGNQAMEEWKFRRVGLGFSVVAIALAVAGLGLYIKKMEQQ